MLDCCQKTLIIIPCYNEEKRLNLKKFSDFLEYNKDVFLLFINDGSSDNTYLLIKQFTEKFINADILTYQYNRGKAEAIRYAMLTVLPRFKGKYIGYFDADLSTPLYEILQFIKFLDNNTNYKVIIGSRVKRLGAVIHRNWIRHIMGRIFASLSSFVLCLAVYDTQCGAKIFSTDLVESCFNKKFLSKWLFDIELIARIILQERDKTGKIYEFVLDEWIDYGESKIKKKDLIILPFELLKIYLKYHNKIKRIMKK